MKTIFTKICLLGLAQFIVVSLCFSASISGKIVYEGKVPKMKAVKMDADPICAAKHTEPVLVEFLVLGDGNTMANIMVSIKSGAPEKDYPVPTDAAVLDQKGCKYTPHVLGVQAGQMIKILNPDGTLHNVHAMPKVNSEFNMAMPKFKKKAMKKFDKAESMFQVKCDVHPWMKAWVGVFSHPFFAVTGKDGMFKIDGLDAGTYEIEAWHEKLGTRTMSVTVGADESKTADFTFSRPSK